MRNAAKLSKRGQTVLLSAPVSEAESDRRLRPVLDALFSHNSKQASKLVQQALQKRPGWPAARALRACVFLQTERRQEAEREMSELRADLEGGRVPISEDALRKMHMYYQELRQENIAGELYEQGWRADPANVRLAEMAFCMYIRGYAFSDAQKLATRLHRLATAQTQKYGLWATAALWLELKFKSRDLEAGEEPDRRMLKLSCAMMKKALAASITPNAETVRFATRVYGEAGQFKDAYDLVSNPRLVMDEVEVLQIRAELPVAEHVTIDDHCKVLLNHDPDDWRHWGKYLDAMERKEDWQAEATEFIDEVLSSRKALQVERRGPRLARMELLHRTSNSDELATSVATYFDMFGGKTVCAHDLRPYICGLRHSEHLVKVFDNLSKVAEVKGFPHHLTLSWLRLWFNKLQDTPEALVNHYTSQLSQDLEPTDRQPGDDYLILAVHRLLPSPEAKGQDRYSDSAAVLQAIAVLEAGLCRSPFNFHFKILLMKLYIEVGGMERVGELWESLEVKHVQLATLTHLVLRPFFETGHHDCLRTVLEGLDTLWRECDREIPDCISKAFQVGSINAAIEFVLFKMRLEKSVIFAEALMTETLLALVTAGGEPLGAARALDCLTSSPRFTPETFSRKKLIDNNDTRCFRFWNTGEYDPNDRMQDTNDEAAEEGTVCSSAVTATLRADFESVASLLQLAAPRHADEGSATTAMTDSVSSNRCNMNGTSETEKLSKLRMDISANMRRIAAVLQSSELKETTDDRNATATAELLLDAKDLAERMVREVRVAGTISPGNYAENRTMAPRTLRNCGKIAFDVLLISSVVIASLSPYLTRAQRRMKRAAAKGGAQTPSATTQQYELIRQAVLAYRDGILSACSLVQEWVAACLESDVDWPSSLFTEEQGLSEMVSFLPDVSHPINLQDGERSDSGALTLSDFCSEIIEKVLSSHSTTCSTILETLGTITRRMKFADL